MESEGTFLVIFAIIVVVGGGLILRAEAAKRRRAAEEQARQEEERRLRWARLVKRFGEENARRITAGEVWQGQTAEMLVEALGQPLDIEERVLKKKTKHVYKYRRIAANRYALKVDLEDGVVVGWDQK